MKFYTIKAVAKSKRNKPIYLVIHLWSKIRINQFVGYGGVLHDKGHLRCQRDMDELDK